MHDVQHEAVIIVTVIGREEEAIAFELIAIRMTWVCLECTLWDVVPFPACSEGHRPPESGPVRGVGSWLPRGSGVWLETLALGVWAGGTSYPCGRRIRMCGQDGYNGSPHPAGISSGQPLMPTPQADSGFQLGHLPRAVCSAPLAACRAPGDAFTGLLFGAQFSKQGPLPFSLQPQPQATLPQTQLETEILGCGCIFYCSTLTLSFLVQVVPCPALGSSL